MTTAAFTPFPKLARLSRDMIVTEKLDGTNAQILIELMGPVHHAYAFDITDCAYAAHEGNLYRLTAGSRNRWITPTSDNFGFAKWVHANADELVKLGEGSHYGEWWGNGIQRTYGLAEKRFSLFNTGRWGFERPTSVVGVVPVLYQGTFDTEWVDRILARLKEQGSMAVPGFMNPEGVVVYHVASKQLFKKTLDKNDDHKGAA